MIFLKKRCQFVEWSLLKKAWYENSSHWILTVRYMKCFFCSVCTYKRNWDCRRTHRMHLALCVFFCSFINHLHQCCFLAVFAYRSQEKGQVIKDQKCFSQGFIRMQVESGQQTGREQTGQSKPSHKKFACCYKLFVFFSTAEGWTVAEKKWCSCGVSFLWKCKFLQRKYFNTGNRFF